MLEAPLFRTRRIASGPSAGPSINEDEASYGIPRTEILGDPGVREADARETGAGDADAEDADIYFFMLVRIGRP